MKENIEYITMDSRAEIPMAKHLNLDDRKIKKIVDLKVKYFNGEISKEKAKRELSESYEKVTAQEFAICEQYLQEYGISDDQLAEGMEDILDIFEGVLEGGKLNTVKGHPIQTYMDEVVEIRNLLQQMRENLSRRFIKNQWIEIYEKLDQIKIHLSRKQNQLYSALEKKGFDKPSKVMWTLDNKIKDTIGLSSQYLYDDRDEEFIKIQEEVIQIIEDMMVKETEILFPTALDLLSQEDFAIMRKGDDEIGYCLISPPQTFDSGNQKVGASNENGMDLLDVSQGKLTLEQINLIFKHLQVDLSYVDENDIVKFYSDTKHRVFPRSPGVIGREVRNCHPRESVSTVEKIIRAFREGEQDKAEFWLEMGNKFIYIIYNAVRDDQGNFRGVLEMMQDVTRIRGLTGNQRLLSWNQPNHEKKKEDNDAKDNAYGITEDTIIGHLTKEYPFMKEYLINLSPQFSKLKNPVLFKTMSSIATLKMISERGNMDVSELIDKIRKEIEGKRE